MFIEWNWPLPLIAVTNYPRVVGAHVRPAAESMLSFSPTSLTRISLVAP